MIAPNWNTEDELTEQRGTFLGRLFSIKGQMPSHFSYVPWSLPLLSLHAAFSVGLRAETRRDKSHEQVNLLACRYEKNNKQIITLPKKFKVMRANCFFKVLRSFGSLPFRLFWRGARAL